MSYATELDRLIADIPADRDGFSRIQVSAEEWLLLGEGLSLGLYDLNALWIDGQLVRMALMSRDYRLKAIVSLKCQDGRYPSIGRLHPPAQRLERAMRDLYQIEPEGLGDHRPWLDHGVWPKAGEDKPERQGNNPYDFLPVEGHGLHQIPVGPVHAGIIEPGHFRFAANGETVVRLEERFGYVHKGVEALCAGQPVERVAPIIARVSGDSTVAYSYAFARAVEAACGIEVPQRALLLRAIMGELERISHHTNDFGAICTDVSAVAIHAHCTLLRERLLQTADACFGHRMMMDRIIPGGVAIDLTAENQQLLGDMVNDCGTKFAIAVQIYDEQPSILDRTVTTGIINPVLVKQFAAGGHIGRSAGRDFDSRRDAAYPPYDQMEINIPLRTEGDVDARARIRADEVAVSIELIQELLRRLEPGKILGEDIHLCVGEGSAFAEAFRGDVFVTVRLDDNGNVAHCHARDASWFQWPLLEAAIEGNIVADFPVCNKSFNCSYSGHDI